MTDPKADLKKIGQDIQAKTMHAGRKIGLFLQRWMKILRRFCILNFQQLKATITSWLKRQPWKGTLRKFWPGNRRPDPNSSAMVSADPAQNELSLKSPKKTKTPPIRRETRQRVYRLNGYTTVAKVQRRHQAELQQRFLRKVILFVGILLALFVLFQIYNPFRGDRTEWFRIIGISELAELTEDNPLFPEITEEDADDNS